MPPIQRILFPTDFSTSARLAEERGCMQASAHGADATAESLLSHGFQGMSPIHQVRGSGLSVGLRI